MAGEAEFPFLFYGAAWESDSPHQYEIRFESPPTAKNRLALAHAFERAMIEHSPTTETDGESWLWADHWAMFQVGWSEKGAQADRTQAAVVEALRAVHAIAPLAEAVVLTARRPGRCKWTEWSRKRQDVPSDAPQWFPDYPFDRPLSAKQKRYEAEPKDDHEFEQARRNVHVEAERAARQQEEERAEKGAIALVNAHPRPKRPAPPTKPKGIKEIFASPDGKLVVGWVDDYEAALLAGNRRIPMKVPRADSRVPPFFTADGKRILLAGNTTQVWAYDIEKDAAKMVFQNVIPRQIAETPDGTLIVRELDRVHLYTPSLEADDDRRLENFHFATHTLALVRGGRVLILANRDANDQATLIVGLKDHDARSLARLDEFVEDVWELDGHVYVEDTKEIINLDAKWKSAFSGEDDGGWSQIMSDTYWDD